MTKIKIRVPDNVKTYKVRVPDNATTHKVRVPDDPAPAVFTIRFT